MAFSSNLGFPFHRSYSFFVWRISFRYPCTITLLCRSVLLTYRPVFIPPLFSSHILSCKPESDCTLYMFYMLEDVIRNSSVYSHVTKRKQTTSAQKKLVIFSQWSCIFISRDLFAESNQKGKMNQRSRFGVFIRFLLSVLLLLLLLLHVQYDCKENSQLGTSLCILFSTLVAAPINYGNNSLNENLQF